jgi:hypothetical protein
LQPYKISQVDNLYYRFTSKAGTVYLCYFISYGFLFDKFPDLASDIFAFNIDVEKGAAKEQPLDIAIAATVAEIIKKFLASKENAVLYICDSTDHKEHIRKRKFDAWFQKHDDGTIIKIDQKAIIEQAIIFNSLLIHKDNPLKNRFIAAFSELNDDSNGK